MVLGLTFSKEMCYPKEEVRERSEGGLSLEERELPLYNSILSC